MSVAADDAKQVAQRIIMRLAAIDRGKPRIDPPSVAAALAEHFAMLGLSCPRLRWVRHLEGGWRRAFKIARLAARSAAESAADSASLMWLPGAWVAAAAEPCSPVELAAKPAGGIRAIAPAWLAAESDAWSALQRELSSGAQRRMRTAAARFSRSMAASAPAAAGNMAPSTPPADDVALQIVAETAVAWPAWCDAFQAAEQSFGVCEPLLKAAEAGLWRFWVTERELIAVPRPSFRVEGERLHGASGPAVSWPNGARYWFWRGVRVPEQVIAAPRLISLADIDDEPNAEVRRVMVERYRTGEEIHGAVAYLRDAGAERLDHDEVFGTLWRRRMRWDEPIVMLEVVNRTPEPDGSYKHYWLRVHPELRPLPPGHWPDAKKRAWLRRQKPQAMTARAAAASIHGRRAEDYRPGIET
jgi:hypothetical protein